MKKTFYSLIAILAINLSAFSQTNKSSVKTPSVQVLIKHAPELIGKSSDQLSNYKNNGGSLFNDNYSYDVLVNNKPSIGSKDVYYVFNKITRDSKGSASTSIVAALKIENLSPNQLSYLTSYECNDDKIKYDGATQVAYIFAIIKSAKGDKVNILKAFKFELKSQSIIEIDAKSLVCGSLGGYFTVIDPLISF
jgi:hypothetical protein